MGAEDGRSDEQPGSHRCRGDLRGGERVGGADDEAADNGRATRDLCALIAWARDNAVFSSRDAAVFLRYQLADEAERAALSDEYGYSGRGLCKRINVLRTRLTQAVKDYALERSELAPDYAALMEQAPAA